jgi:putative transposase
MTSDGSQANAAAITYDNAEYGTRSDVRQVRYLNDMVEQDHRAVKRIVRPKLGCKSMATAQYTVAGIEVMPMLKQGQMIAEAWEQNQTPAEQFYALAA